MKQSKKKLEKAEQEALLLLLKKRFDSNMQRHPSISWDKIQNILESNPEMLWILNQMEQSGGEPDVIIFDNNSDEIHFVDCSAETPKGRRNLCYDRKALDARKSNKPQSNAMDIAQEMGIELLNEEEYRKLQSLGTFDTKTSSWIKTPDKIRALGGALFGDQRYDTVFIYHNGADSYFSSRGFRGKLKL